MRSIEARDGAATVRWTNGWSTVFPPDDVPWVCREDGSRSRPRFEEIDPDRLFYVEPHDALGCPTLRAGFQREPAGVPAVSARHDRMRARACGRRVGARRVLLAVLAADGAGGPRVRPDGAAGRPGQGAACLDRLAEGATALALGQAAAGVDAVLISSAFAGAGFISRAHYREFVLPYEKAIVDRTSTHDVPVYTHTCGAIGDRLELMVDTGTERHRHAGPAAARHGRSGRRRRRTLGRVFLKGNIDPVNTILLGTPGDVLGRRAVPRHRRARRRLHPQHRLRGSARRPAREHPGASRGG